MARLKSRSGSLEKRKIKFRNAKRKTVSQKVRESDSLLAFLLVFFLCAVSISYLFQTNSIATQGYEVEEYEAKLEDLKNENREMKNQEAELRSMKNLENEKVKLSATVSSDIDYLVSTDTAVAMKQ